ncbi:MAG: hypothetical protein ACNS62_06155 [Candidatus Cyclobacteriaceae bacterium M3_2C_046]
MPTYIYIHPDTNEEIEIFHSMSEVKKPSLKLLEQITLPDGRVMQRKIVAPALVGFDNLGRSVKKTEGSTGDKSDKGAASKKETTPAKKEAAPAKSESKAA